MKENLDFQCATIAKEIAESAKEQTLRKALGALKEDGVYALFLYLLSEKDKNTVNALGKLLREQKLVTLNDSEQIEFNSPWD